MSGNGRRDELTDYNRVYTMKQAIEYVHNLNKDVTKYRTPQFVNARTGEPVVIGHSSKSV